MPVRLKRGDEFLQSEVFIIIRMTNMGTVFGATSETRLFGPTSTTDDVLAGADLQGKRILVTGVSAGIGVETARSLAAHGAQVVGAARDLKKAEAAIGQVQKDAAANGGNFELVELDLANLWQPNQYASSRKTGVIER